MSLPKSVILRKEKLTIRNAQSNTMVCKENMNLLGRTKKMREATVRHPAILDPEESRVRYCTALTELTVMVLSFSVPVTLTLAPACLSSVARAALSLVSRV